MSAGKVHGKININCGKGELSISSINVLRRMEVLSKYIGQQCGKKPLRQSSSNSQA
jgi:hypothetical protein